MSSVIVIDGKGHVCGRLAAAVAKQLLKGRRVVVVRAEEVLLNGTHRLNHHDFARFLHKTTNYNPTKGPNHHRAPAEMLHRAIRGMVPYKTIRGEKAMNNLKVFEGIPTKYATVQRLVVPAALRVVSIRVDRPTTKLGKLSTTFGWKYGSIVAQLEAKRKEVSATRYAKKNEEAARRKRAVEAANKKLGEAAVRFIENYVE